MYLFKYMYFFIFLDIYYKMKMEGNISQEKSVLCKDSEKHKPQAQMSHHAEHLYHIYI